MRVWRLTHRKWALSAFDGQGAYLFGGRWNPKGVRCVYTSTSSALAVLEVLVHMDKRHLGATQAIVGECPSTNPGGSPHTSALLGRRMSSTCLKPLV